MGYGKLWNGQKSQKHLEKTVKYKNNRCTIGNLWKENQPPLPFNKPLALSRFSCLGKKIRAKPWTYKSKYKETINDYINIGHAVTLLQEKPKNVTTTTNYVWQHSIVNIGKPEKARVVFDAAAEFQNTSLNKKLLKDSDYRNNLVGILLRLHREKFAVMGDIE